MKFEMTKSDWYESERLSMFTLKQIGFSSSDEVRSALRRNNCMIVAKSTPINVEGDYK